MAFGWNEIQFNLFTDTRTKSVNIISDKYFSYESFRNTGAVLAIVKLIRSMIFMLGIHKASVYLQITWGILAREVSYRKQFSNFYRLMAQGFIAFNEAEER